MSLVTIAIGSILVLLGVGGYLGFGRTSVTALIPAFFGLPLLALGVIALQPNLRRHAMHIASVVALLGLLGTVRGLVLLIVRAVQGQEIAPRLMVQAAMAILCGVLLGLYIKSFANARRRRNQPGHLEG